MLVTDSAEIEAAAEAISRSDLVAFDLEFVSQDRLVPELCLVQVAWVSGGDDGLDAAAGPAVAGGARPEAQVPRAARSGARADARPEVRLIDPLRGDAAPIVRALAAHPQVVAHAPRQDLALLAARFDASLPGLVDTQLMAAFCGIGDQVGLATLAGELLGVQLAKEMQWTDWARRPLSDAQLAYAEADVLHLPALHARLAARLGPRLAWVREETAEIAAEALAATRVTPETAWRNVGGARGLEPAAHAAMVALAAWRQRTAIALDRPLGQVLTDKLLVDFARHRPDTPGAVRAAKGLSPHARQRAPEIVEAIAAAAPAAAVGPRAAARAGSVRVQRWTEMLLAIVQVVAEATGIAPRLLAPRADAEAFARAYDEGGPAAAAALPALATWRRDVIGRPWEDWLTGRAALVGDPAAPHGIRLVPRG